ncbi:MAG TPA: hypothetical protein VE176_11720, partial [Candidatus Limnocylindrales bacterium]|nr:hypothetical protein [Candidatus Limnocylindrales bacterium]
MGHVVARATSVIRGSLKPSAFARVVARTVGGISAASNILNLSAAMRAISGGRLAIASGTITYVSSGPGASSTGSPIVIAVPSGVRGILDNNTNTTLLMYVVASSSAGTVDITTNAAWNLVSKVLNYNIGSTNYTLASYYRVASSEPISYTIAGTSSTSVAGMGGLIIAYTGTLPGSPINSSTNAGTSGSGGAITFVADGGYNISALNSNLTLTKPSGTS